jgi:cytochrome P450
MTMTVLGLPLEEWQRFTVPFHKIAYSAPGSPAYAEAQRGIEWYLAYMRDQIAEQRKERRPGLISYLMDVDAVRGGKLGDGDRLNDREVFILALQVIAGGVDTTTALTSNTLMFLNGDAAARQKLFEDRSLLPKACEEFMRLAAPVQALSRTAAHDVEIGGQKIKAGERIMFAFASANRDGVEFENPDDIQVDRFPNRHLGFGIGIHRCIGSTFARMMFGVMLDAIFERMPDFRIDAERAARYPAIPAVNGWKSIPATFTPGKTIMESQTIPAWKDAIDFSGADGAVGLSVAAAIAG